MVVSRVVVACGRLVRVVGDRVDVLGGVLEQQVALLVLRGKHSEVNPPEESVLPAAGAEAVPNVVSSLAGSEGTGLGTSEPRPTNLPRERRRRVAEREPPSLPPAS